MNNTSEVVTLSIIALNLGASVKNEWPLKWPKNKIYENSIIPIFSYLQILVIFRHECYIESLYGS